MSVAARVSAVMLAHILYPPLDPEWPASLSRPIVAGLLRSRMGYDGVVITDDLEMGAVTRHYEFADALRQVMRAEIDLSLICHSAALVEEARDRMARRIVASEKIRRRHARSHQAAHAVEGGVPWEAGRSVLNARSDILRGKTSSSSDPRRPAAKQVKAGGRHHGRIVAAERGRRDMALQPGLSRFGPQTFPQAAVGRHPARQRRLGRTPFPRGMHQLEHQHVHHRLLEAGGDVRQVVGVRSRARGCSGNRRLDPAEAEIEAALIEEGAREADAARDPPGARADRSPPRPDSRAPSSSRPCRKPRRPHRRASARAARCACGGHEVKTGVPAGGEQNHEGEFGAGSSRNSAWTWASRWLTPTHGTPRANASALAKEKPTSSEPTSPGPRVAAIPCTASSPTPDSDKAWFTTGSIASRCRREASSGTTPP